jgi:hypothetical protein
VHRGGQNRARRLGFFGGQFIAAPQYQGWKGNQDKRQIPGKPEERRAILHREIPSEAVLLLLWIV